ncbi:PRD domain-containing protein [Enterococcus sp. AZ163]|uniref:PRD domain-containing protein n=1 Tax=Enterococcus sp. AZ163 TaxID=2774638 RepID=UPI003D285AA5
MKLSREEEILLEVDRSTKEAILKDRYEEFGRDALSLSVDLAIDRSNVSRILNNLWNNGLLAKIQGKPTYYFSKNVVEQFFPTVFIPSTLEAGIDLKKFLSEHASEEKSNEISLSQNYYGFFSPNGSLYRQAQQLTSHFFPKPLINQFTIYGAANTGKRTLVNYLFDEGKKAGVFTKHEKPFFIDVEKLILSEEKYADLLLGSIYENSKRKGLLTKLEHGLLVIDKAECLPKMIYRLLRQIGESGYFYEFNQPSKERILNTSIVFLVEEEVTSPVTQSVLLPNFCEKPIAEKIQFCLHFLEKAANISNQSIKVHKDILSCLVTSNYQNNLAQLEQEIFSAVSRARFAAKSDNQMIAEITFDELSDTVLERITITNPLVAELNSYLNCWETDSLYFVPQTQDNTELIKKRLTEEQRNTSIIGNSQIIMDECMIIYNQFFSLSESEVQQIKAGPFWLIIKQQYSKKTSEKEKKGLVAFAHYLETYFEEKKRVYKPKKFVKIPIEANRFFTKATEIKKHLKKELGIILTNEEFDLAACYFMYLNQLSKKEQLPIVILCHGENIGLTYIKYINTLSLSPIELHAIDYVSEDDREFRTFIKEFKTMIKSINNGNGVIIASDIEPLTTIHSLIESELNIQCQTFSPVSLPLLLEIIKKIQLQNYSISDFKREDNKRELQVVTQSFDNELIDKLAHSLLADSLVFLDPNKTANILFTILEDLLTQLNLENSEEITVRFVVHCSFMLERVIKRETMNFPKLRDFINTNSSLFHSVEIHLSRLNNIFDIMIPSNEYAFVCEIFKDLYGI